ncbi:MAG: hypothetical protein WBK26_02490 [Burkholderiaceae bacterium]
MSNRLDAFVRRISERANGSQIDHNSQCDANVATPKLDVPVVATRPLAALGSAPDAEVKSVHPVTEGANVTDVTHFFLPDQTQEKKSTVAASAFFSDGAPQFIESATSVTKDVGGHSSEDPEEEIKVIDISANLDASEAKDLRPDQELSEFLEWTHVTATCLTLVDVETGCATDISAATPVVIFRSITEARRLCGINSNKLSLQQAMWLAICRGYLLVYAAQRVFLTNPVYQHKQFQIYQPLNKE